MHHATNAVSSADDFLLRRRRSRVVIQSHRRSCDRLAPILVFVSSLTRGTPLFGLVPVVLFVARKRPANTQQTRTKMPLASITGVDSLTCNKFAIMSRYAPVILMEGSWIAVVIHRGESTLDSQIGRQRRLGKFSRRMFVPPSVTLLFCVARAHCSFLHLQIKSLHLPSRTPYRSWLSPCRPPYDSANSQANGDSSVSCLASHREYCILPLANDIGHGAVDRPVGLSPLALTPRYSRLIRLLFRTRLMALPSPGL